MKLLIFDGVGVAYKCVKSAARKGELGHGVQNSLLPFVVNVILDLFIFLAEKNVTTARAD